MTKRKGTDIDSDITEDPHLHSLAEQLLLEFTGAIIRRRDVPLLTAMEVAARILSEKVAGLRSGVRSTTELTRLKH